MKTITPIKTWNIAVLGVVLLTSVVNASDVFRADNANTLDNPAAWVGNVTPTAADVAVFDNTVQLNTNSTVGVDTNWAGIRIANPGGIISFNAGNTLTLGPSGIDMSAATVSLILANNTIVLSNQTWNIATNLAITSSGPIGDNADGLGRT